MSGAAVALRRAMLKILTVLVLSSTTALAAPAPVVGGTTVPKGEWPDAVAVLADTAACTGTLIAPDVVLTAGHCIETRPKIVVVDSVDFLDQSAGEVIAVTSATAYPDWQHKYDVGVLVLAHAAKTKPRAIAAACTAKELVANAKVRVVGFGLTTQAGTGDNSKLHQADLGVTDPTCALSGCEKTVAPSGEFVAGGHGKDACFGDSGGPVYLGDALIGVVSRGMSSNNKPCGDGGIFVRADTVVGWIEQVTRRKLVRATCDKADTEDTSDGAGGCAAAGGAGLPIALVGLALVRRRRRA